MAKYTRRFACGEWWLSQRAGVWYRCRFNPRTRQTERHSLGTKDLPLAQERLTEWWIENVRKPERDISDVLLSELLLAYYHQHAKAKASGKRIFYMMPLINDFFGEETVKVACHPARLEEFVKAMRAKGLKDTYIDNLITIIKSSVNRAWKRGELDRAPYIGLLGAKSLGPKGRALKVEEMAYLLDHAAPHIEVMMMIQLATACRPSEAAELTWEQIDFDSNLINLNQPARPQTKKHRGIVCITPSFRAWLLARRQKSGLLVQWRGKAVRRWETGWRSARKGMEGAGNVNPYSVRHSVARACRKANVSKWELDNQLSHTKGNQTDIYAPHAPDYLQNATAAIEKLMQAVAACRKRDAQKLSA